MDALTNLDGIVYGLDESAYFAADALSKSKLTNFATMSDEDVEQTAAMQFGSLVHCMLLTPDLTPSRYVKTDLDRKGTKAWAEAEEQAQGAELIKAEEWNKAELMVESIISHNEAWSLIKGCVSEVSCFWTDEETGLRCKARIDILGERMLDLKTCVSAKPSDFAKDIAKRRYHWQDVHYTSGLMSVDPSTIENMVFVAVEKTPKRLMGSGSKLHQIGLYEISTGDRLLAIEQVDYWKRLYKACLDSNDWPTYSRQIETISLPAWAHYEDQRFA